VVVPEGIDDPARPSGGNVYDRRICGGLTAAGWSVHERAVPGAWPSPDRAACAALAEAVADVPDGGIVLVDGLIASAAPEELVPGATRLRLVVLVHMPLGDAPLDAPVADTRERERAVLTAAAAVVTTSEWTRDRLRDLYSLQRGVHVARPGVDAADRAPGTTTGGELVCVAAVTPHKGHDVLLDALATLTDLAWRCRCVGPVDRDPSFVDERRRQARADGLGERVLFTGPLSGADLDAAYGAADLLVLASRAETYGMVVTEALARGLPVVATAVGGVPESLGWAGAVRPGLLVPPGDVAGLAAALRHWLDDDDLRQRLRQAAAERRTTLPAWSTTTEQVARVLTAVAP